MTREELEANWLWDDQRGSIPFKRPRLTPKNIADQQRLAQPGTLIHSASEMFKCERRDTMVDFKRAIVGGTPNTEGEKYPRVAHHIENVNCLNCRKQYFALERRTK